MPTNDIDGGRIGRQINLTGIELPSDVGAQLMTLYGTDEPPTTVAEWVAGMEAVIGREWEDAPTVEDLCTTEDGDHTFTSVDGAVTQDYICVLDPIAYPFITDTPGTITTVTAVREEPITIEVDESGISTDGDGAIVSLGVSDHVEDVEDVTPETIYRQICGYVQTFEDEVEYEQWAGDVDAATTPLSLDAGIAVAGEIGTTLFEE